ncbi:hypothetical protein HR45_09965 [Shewanella mangrovi]|uniref:DUF4124 domain-containing protein n=1 Tax=Shewanella mangrovi TaxID=1515746 RepID=A0A094JH63_9GAMM|nr:DUF4124 domain-containing protein [Shewanella mangrovi]KFZ37344.1 hypothetical protein HR45_09965 [Shewanella mangrovi]
MLRNSLLVVMLAMLALPIANATTIYKWVDKNGVAHFSQDPPAEGEQVQQLDAASMEPKKIGTVAPERSEPAAAPETATSKATVQNAEQAKSICEQATFQLNVLNTHTRLQRTDPATGETVQMTEEERQQQIATQQERIKLFCGKS